MKKATTNETTFICVKPIIKAEYTIRIVGDSPLLVHAWSEKAKKEMLQAQQGKKLMSAFINATKKLAAAHSVRMDRLNELPAVEEQPEQTAFDRTCAPAGKLIDTRDAAIRG